MTELDELYDLYSTTPEGLHLRQLLIKIDRYCTPWMSAILINQLKKELLVQLIERDFTDMAPFESLTNL